MKSSKNLKNGKKGENRKVTLIHNGTCNIKDNIPRQMKTHCNINGHNEFGDSPLHIAVRHGHLECAYSFLRIGADVNIKRPNGYSVLHTAAALGYTDIIQSLIERGAIVDAKTVYGETPLLSAVCESKLESVELLLRHGASVNASLSETEMTALHIAASKSPDCIDALLNAEADIFAINKFGVSPLELTMEIGSHYFTKMCAGKSNVSSKDGITALHLASRCVNAECLEMLILNGCDVNITTNKGDTPLHYACGMEKFMDYEQVTTHVEFSVTRNIQMLLKAGANINRRNNVGLAPLHVSTDHNQSVAASFLLKHGANANLRGGRKRQTPLLFAADNGNLQCIKFLLESGANKLVVDAEKNTALMLAAKKSHFECVKLLLHSNVPLW